jgi:hypothetical protein
VRSICSQAPSKRHHNVVDSVSLLLFQEGERTLNIIVILVILRSTH